MVSELHGASQALVSLGGDANVSAENLKQLGDYGEKALQGLKDDLQNAKLHLNLLSATKATPEDIAKAQQEVKELEIGVKQVTIAFNGLQGQTKPVLDSIEQSAKDVQGAIVEIVPSETQQRVPIHHVCFRTPTIPIRPGSLTVILGTISGEQLTLTANEAGEIETAQAHGSINYETGFVDIYFYTKTKITEANRTEIEAEEWYLPDLEFLEGTDSYINVPFWIAADSVRFNAVAYTYIPLDADILGLSATRLPPDGRVPIFRVGDIGIISATKLQELPSHVAGQTYNMNDQRISWCELQDAHGSKEPFDLYTVDYDYGRVTLGSDFALGTLVAPVSAKYRYQDMGLINDVQINGHVTFTKPLTHNYQAENTVVGSALAINDMQSRYTAKFVQSVWNNSWVDTASGASLSANYNDALYPIQVTNKGAIQERWAIVFTDNLNFRIIGEDAGQIGTGSINSDCSPINPITGSPYFTIKKEGWGTGWASGNVLRFNTKAATFPVWCIRTVKQSEPSTISDQFQIMFRGDINRNL